MADETQQQEQEEWRPIAGFAGYEVSNLGRVRSWHRRGYKRSADSAEPPHPLTPTWNRKGYGIVQLCADGTKFARYVHRLALDTFRGPKEKGQVCRHLDGNPRNNHLDNLAWGNSHENMADQERHGTRPKGAQVYGSRLSAADVLAIRALPSEMRSSAIAREYGVDAGTIRRIRRGASWQWLREHGAS
jgi:hypothetical protein